MFYLIDKIERGGLLFLLLPMQWWSAKKRSISLVEILPINVTV